MIKIFTMTILLSLSSMVFAEQDKTVGVINDIRNYLVKNEHADTFPADLGNFIASNPQMKLDVEEALRYAVITNEQYREKSMHLMSNSGLILPADLIDLNKQISKYGEIIAKFKDITKNISKEDSYNGLSCTGLDDYLYTPQNMNMFKRRLKITDVSAHQDFLPFYNDTSIIIFHIPSLPAVMDYVKSKSKIKFVGLEEKLIYSNATAATMFKSVKTNADTYLMFPQRIFPPSTNSLEDITFKEYAFLALNLSLVNRLNDEVYQTFYKIYRRNAALCLYSKR